MAASWRSKVGGCRFLREGRIQVFCLLALLLAPVPCALGQQAAALPALLSPNEMPAGFEPIYLSPWAGEILKLTQAGVEDGVTLSFVSNSAGVFNLGADQIIVLRDLGVSSVVINGMIEHDREFNTTSGPTSASTVPMPTGTPSVGVAAAATDGSAQATWAAIRAWNASVAAATPPPQLTPAVAPVTPLTLAFAAPTVGAEARSNGSEGQGGGLADGQSLELEAAAAPGLYEGVFEAEGQVPAASVSAYPIREPYPVQLTLPIVMFRAAGRPPNVQILQPLH